MPFRYDNSTNQISLLRDMIERLRAEIERLQRYVAERDHYRRQWSEGRAEIERLEAAQKVARQWERTRVCVAAEIASVRFGQWIPQHWLELFMDAYESAMSNETADLQMFNHALEKALVAECDSQRARIERLEAVADAARTYLDEQTDENAAALGDALAGCGHD